MTQPILHALARTPEGAIEMVWEDGHRTVWTADQLRAACPCATCREKKKSAPASPMLLPVLRPEEAQPMGVQGMKPVGTYGYNIQFSDLHNSGIFTLEVLAAGPQDGPE